MTLLIDGKPEELAQFLNLFANDTDDTENNNDDDTDTDDDTDDTGNDTDDGDKANDQFALEFAALINRYPHVRSCSVENGAIKIITKS